MPRTLEGPADWCFPDLSSTVGSDPGLAALLSFSLPAVHESGSSEGSDLAQMVTEDTVLCGIAGGETELEPQVKVEGAPSQSSCHLSSLEQSQETD